MKTEIDFQFHKSKDSPGLPQTSFDQEASAEQSVTTFEAEHAERTQRARSLLSQLDPAQTAVLTGWLMDPDLTLQNVLDLVAAPPPAGFGLRTHTTTLHRIRAAERAAIAAGRMNQMIDCVSDLHRISDLSQAEAAQKVISNLLHARAVELATDSPDSEILPRLLAGIARLCALEHKRSLLVLKRAKSQSNSQTTRHHHVDVNIIRPAPAPLAPKPQQIH